MSLPFPFFVGLRYLRSRRRARFVSVVAAVALSGLALGVMSLVVVLSVMNGFDRELHLRILGLIPHVLVREPERELAAWQSMRPVLEAEEGVRAVLPYIGGTAMLSTPGVVRGVELAGIRVESDGGALGLEEHMRRGSIEALRGGRFGIVLGELLARSLRVAVGDRVSLILPELNMTPAGVFPRMRRFEVVGTFAVGAQVDANAAFVHFDDASRLYRTQGAPLALRLMLDDPQSAPEVSSRLRALLGPAIEVQDWSATQGNLFGAVRMEKRMVTLLLLVIVAVAAFNIVSILTMVVAEKRGAIAVLRTMGASARQIMAVFAVQGILIGAIGVAAGVAIGVPVALNIGEIAAAVERLFGFRIFDPGVYFISHIPSELRGADLALIVLSGAVLSIVATLYPALKAARIGPSEVLRYE